MNEQVIVGATWGEDMCELASVVLTTVDPIRYSFLEVGRNLYSLKGSGSLILM